MNPPGITDDEKLRKLIALLNNQLFQEKVIQFRNQWKIPIVGFPDAGEDYKAWVERYSEYSESILKDFNKIASRCSGLHSRIDPVFNGVLSVYLLFNRFLPSYPGKTHLPSALPKIKASGTLGYADVTFTLPLFFSFENVQSALMSFEGIINGFTKNVNESFVKLNEEIEVKLDEKEIENAFLRVVPGNGADIVATAQENIEYLVEFGRNLLRESASRLKSTKIEKYDDKNRHISAPIQQMGTFLSSRGLHNIAEIYWGNITDETMKLNSEFKFDPLLNMGISLANTGVYQLAQGKIDEGLFHLYRAHEDDREILEKLAHPETNTEKNLVSSVLYEQFEKRMLDWLYNDILSVNPALSGVPFRRDDAYSISTDLTPTQRIQFFGILCKMRVALLQEREISNLISRGNILNAFSDLGIWIEDATRKKNPATQSLFNLFQNLLKFGGFNTMSHSLDELKANIDEAEKSSKSQNETNAKVTILVRNFSEHNFESDSHDFFRMREVYLARIMFSLLFLKNNKRF